MGHIEFNLNVDKLQNALKQQKRLDNRKFDEYRPITMQRNISENANGSVRVKLGETDVAVGVKFGLEKPYPDSPDEGSITVGAELLPMASPSFEAGPPSEDSIELARVVDRSLRESKMLDFKSLGVRSGELAMFAFVDIYVFNYDGNLFDASNLAALAALYDAKLPKIEEDKIVLKEYAGKLKLKRKPILCTFAKLGNAIVLDPSLAEEANLDARFSVATTEDDYVCAAQKGGSGSFTADEIMQMTDIAFAKGKELRKHI